jgi:subfamily B ATP-binding cassette protein MsbA
MLRRIKPYLPQVVLSVIFTVLFSLLSSASIVMIQPFLRTLFTEGEQVVVTEGARRGDSTTDVPAVTEASDDERRAETGGEDATEAKELAREPLPRDRLDFLGRDSWLRRSIGNLRDGVNDFLLRGSKLEALWRIVLVFFVLFLTKNIAQYFGSVLIVYVGQRVIKDLRDDLFVQFTRLPLSFFHRIRAGELISRATNDVQIANMCVNVSFTNLFRDPVLILTYLGVCLYISWKLTLLALTVLPLSMVIIIWIGKLLRRYSHRQQEKLADLTSVLQEAVYGIRVIKAFAMERFETQKFLNESERLFRDLFKIARVQRLSSPLTEQLSVIVGLVILWFGGRQVLVHEALAPDMFITFVICLFSLVKPIKELGQVNNGIQEGMAAAQRIFAVLDAEPETTDATAGYPLTDVRGRVEFEQVSFAYQAGVPVLRDVSLTVEPGEVVALVGSSGAGKSTLVDLIPRFYEPSAGRILIDGKDIRDLSLETLRRAMGIVTQEVILFNASVRENIAYGLQEVDPVAVEAAARAANAHEFIQALPAGYETLIGDRGTRLSGGQRQRLSIARAILKNPPILILDEATSALDTESEQLVQEAIDRLVQDRTTFVIAHRLSTIQNADRIYVLQEGRIVEVGNHETLLAAHGVYADLHQRQFRD